MSRRAFVHPFHPSLPFSLTLLPFSQRFYWSQRPGHSGVPVHLEKELDTFLRCTPPHFETYLKADGKSRFDEESFIDFIEECALDGFGIHHDIGARYNLPMSVCTVLP
jgi:hypothetical protein